MPTTANSTQPAAPLGRSGALASRIGIGTWAIGGREWGGQDRAAAVEAIRTALDQGLTLLDTAPIYGFGSAEKIVGEAIRGRRAEVVLATKCGFVWDETGGDPAFRDPTVGEVSILLSPDSIRRQVDASLRRLGADHIDLYQVHRPESTTPIPETMGVLMDLVSEGKIGAIGVSNLTVEQLAGYIAAGDLATDQEQFNMLDRQHQNELFPLCAANGVGVLAYSPLAMGLLSGKLRGRAFGSDDLRGTSARFAAEILLEVEKFIEGLRPIAAIYDCSLSQLVIAWTLAQPAVTHVLSGMRTREQAVENAAAGRVILSADHLADIDARLAAANIQTPPVFG